MADGSQEFCLRWNNHQATIISVFDYLLENETLVDCTLAAEGQYLKAHKVVLCACSPYLEILLSQHNDKHPILIFKDIKFTELKSMIDYMYKGEVNIAQDQLNHFLKAAESLQIKGLSESEDEAAPQTAVPTPRPPPPRAPPAQRTQPRPFSNAVAIRSTGPDEDSPKRVIGRSDAQSPTPRKRRRQAPLGLQGRPSLSDDASNASDGHYDQANCDVPTPALTSTPSAPSSDTASDKAVAKVETNSELMLEPKTEYDDNDNSVEDITLDDDDEDYSQAGTSQLDNSQGNFGSWQQMVGDQSTDNFSGQDTGAQNSQEKALVLADRSLKKTSSSTCLESPKSDLSSLSMASSSYVTPMSPSVVLSTTSPISLDGMSSSSTSALVPYQASYARQKYSSTPSPMSLGAMSPSSALVPYQASNIRHKYSCKHCKAYTTYNITEIIYHGKTCTYMLRPNLYKFKYVCYECNFGAYQIAHLKRHIYTHTGEKPYNCMYCSYSSTHKYNIQKHIKVHTSKCEKQFPCLYCKMRFDTSFDLLKHMTCIHSTFSLDCSKSTMNTM